MLRILFMIAGICMAGPSWGLDASAASAASVNPESLASVRAHLDQVLVANQLRKVSEGLSLPSEFNGVVTEIPDARVERPVLKATPIGSVRGRQLELKGDAWEFVWVVQAQDDLYSQQVWVAFARTQIEGKTRYCLLQWMPEPGKVSYLQFVPYGPERPAFSTVVTYGTAMQSAEVAENVAPEATAAEQGRAPPPSFAPPPPPKKILPTN